jgi:saccharopine dehydrogenase-like NADP-dependent oxidoreductase
MRIVVLGGSGMMGCISVQDLARSEGVSEVVIAARNMDKAQQVADYIGSSKVSLAQVDVCDWSPCCAAPTAASTALSTTPTCR